MRMPRIPVCTPHSAPNHTKQTRLISQEPFNYLAIFGNERCLCRGGQRYPYGFPEPRKLQPSTARLQFLIFRNPASFLLLKRFEGSDEPYRWVVRERGAEPFSPKLRPRELGRWEGAVYLTCIHEPSSSRAPTDIFLWRSSIAKPFAFLHLRAVKQTWKRWD